MVIIASTEKTEKREKYKHPEEDAWKKNNPGKEFKPFDPYRKIPNSSDKDT